MTGQFLAGVIAALALGTALVGPVAASAVIGYDDAEVSGGGAVRLPPYLQCVPYARQVSGVKIYGDAWTWWGQAEGKYERGTRPRVGAVMSFRPHGNMRLGHVAAVSRILDSRTVLIRHANWSPINGRRGQIEDNVRAIDVSEDNDWSRVRVWFGPIEALGGTHWPLNGFIYNRAPGKRLDEGTVLARAPKREAEAKVQLASATRGGGDTGPPAASRGRSADPIGEIIASRMARTTIAARSPGNANRLPGLRELALRN